MLANEGTEMRSPEDVRKLKRFQRYCNLQREEILELRAKLYKAEYSLERLRAYVNEGIIS